MSHKKFITTTLPYSNSIPHIGHALEFIIGDAISRYYRNKLGDDNVFFNVGLDEHGKKISDAAFKAGKLPLDFLDENEIKWREFCHRFEISFDNFYRTSDYPHYSKVQRFWVDLEKKGLIYEKEYSGKYCIGCESFKTDRDLVDGKCPDHHNLKISVVNENNYFFRLSDFKEEIKSLYQQGKITFIPSSKKNEVLNLIDDLQDISISRHKDSVRWGIPVPTSKEQTIYVWFEALLNYLFAAGYGSSFKDFESNWQNSIQIFGPDNIRFQSIIFQGILVASEIKNTSTLLCHGTILDKNGVKMSKTIGNVVDPINQLEKYGIDAVKYYALAGLNIYSNSSWNEDDLVKIYNSHLADDYGNLLTRVVTLLHRGLKDNELVGDPKIALDHTLVENSKITNLVREQVSEIKDLWDAFRITEALDETNKLVKWCNKYINDSEPWKKHDCWWTVLLEVHYFLTLITELYIPLFPEKSKIALDSLQEVNKVVLFPKIVL
jgi:methionyl-tRNA synthetase